MEAVNNNNPLLSPIGTSNAQSSTKITKPSDPQIGRIFEAISRGELTIPEIKLMNRQNDVLASKEIIGYELMHRDSAKLNQWRECTSPKELDEHMKSLGYVPVQVTFEDNGEVFTTTLYHKDDYKLVYAVNTDIVHQGILPQMTDPKRFDNKKWLFNYQDKLCVSILKPGGKFYYSLGKVALVLEVKPRDIVETFPRDKLSPVGLRLTDLKDYMTHTPEDLEEEQRNMLRVKNYVVFQKNYRTLLQYCDAIVRASLVEALGDPNLREEATTLMVALDEVGKKMSWEPLKGEFHQTSALCARLKGLREFIAKHADKLDTPDLYRAIFQAEPSSSKSKESILTELDALVDHAEKMDRNYSAYNIHVLSKMAPEWGPKYGHLDVSKTTAYLAGRVHGRTALTSENNPDAYNELNVQIPKIEGLSASRQVPNEIEIAGLLVDIAVFDEASGQYKIDVQATSATIIDLTNQIEKKKAEIEQVKNSGTHKVRSLHGRQLLLENELEGIKRSLPEWEAVLEKIEDELRIAQKPVTSDAIDLHLFKRDAYQGYLEDAKLQLMKLEDAREELEQPDANLEADIKKVKLSIENLEEAIAEQKQLLKQAGYPGLDHHKIEVLQSHRDAHKKMIQQHIDHAVELEQKIKDFIVQIDQIDPTISSQVQALTGEMKKLGDQKWLLEAKLNIFLIAKDCKKRNIPLLCTGNFD